MKKETLFARVVNEFDIYDSAEDAAIDHLNMAHSHLFEEFEGRDIELLLTDISKLTQKVKDFKNAKEEN